MITVQLEPDGPITEMDEALLTPNHSVVDNEHEHTVVTEYHLNGRVVHRSVHVTLKVGVGVEGVLGRMM